jgi:Protein of unknown function (DUF4058)
LRPKADHNARLIIYAADQLQGNLPSDSRARVEVRVVVGPGDSDSRSVYPDIRIVQRGHGPSHAAAAETSAATLEPITLRLDDEPMTETFIEIIEVCRAV